MNTSNELILLLLISAGILFIQACEKEDDNRASTITDIDGNIYNTVKIGTQWWMAENLKTTKLKDGTAIQMVLINTEWDTLTTPAFCWYNNDLSGYGNTYGALYNWYTVKSSSLCPSGWHVPAESEWKELTDYITTEGHSGTEGTVLKSKEGWHNNGNGTDDYGFKGLPGGYRTYNGSSGGFNESIEFSGHWWSSTEHFSHTDGIYLSLYYFESKAIIYHLYKSNGISVRCIKD